MIVQELAGFVAEARSDRQGCRRRGKHVVESEHRDDRRPHRGGHARRRDIGESRFPSSRTESRVVSKALCTADAGPVAETIRLFAVTVLGFRPSLRR